MQRQRNKATMGQVDGDRGPRSSDTEPEIQRDRETRRQRLEDRERGTHGYSERGRQIQGDMTETEIHLDRQ